MFTLWLVCATAAAATAATTTPACWYALYECVWVYKWLYQYACVCVCVTLYSLHSISFANIFILAFHLSIHIHTTVYRAATLFLFHFDLCACVWVLVLCMFKIHKKNRTYIFIHFTHTLHSILSFFIPSLSCRSDRVLCVRVWHYRLNNETETALPAIYFHGPFSMIFAIR